MENSVNFRDKTWMISHQFANVFSRQRFPLSGIIINQDTNTHLTRYELICIMTCKGDGGTCGTCNTWPQ